MNYNFIYFFFIAIGISLVYVPSVLIISEWPFRKRLFSNTLIVCGTSIGICVYPIICEIILKHYDLFDTLFILSSIQLNLLVGTTLLISFKDYYGNHHHKMAKQLSNGHNSNGHSHHLHPSSNHHNHHNHQSSSHHGHHKGGGKNDHFHDDESTNSQSTDNFTLKQHWRRFCQTRKSNLKTRKNLFHLIAEEKRKSRALSKGSLEDGFVITTSNNLLAPDDPNVVLLSRKSHSQPSGTTHSTTTHKPNLLSRIANSLRSLTHHHGSNHEHSSSNDKHHTSHHHHSSANHHHHSHHHHHHSHNSHSYSHQTSTITEQSNEKLMSDHDIHSSATTPITTVTAEKPVGLELMNVFIKPTDLPEKTTASETVNHHHHHHHYHHQSENNDIKNKENANTLEFFNYNDHDHFSHDSSEHSSNSNSDEEEEYSPTSTPYQNNYMDTALIEESASYFSAASMKSSRYMSYRNSLTNSVKGSLIECSVPEDREEEEEENENNTKNTQKSSAIRHHPHNYHHYRHAHGYNYHHHHPLHHNYHRKNNHRLNSTPNTAHVNNLNTVNMRIFQLNERIRKANTLSIIDTSSFINLPLNTKTLYHNFHNSFIKNRTSNNSKNTNGSKNSKKPNKNNNNNNGNLKTVNFINYLKYLLDKNLFLNAFIFLINFTYSISLIGKLFA